MSIRHDTTEWRALPRTLRKRRLIPALRLRSGHPSAVEPPRPPRWDSSLLGRTPIETGNRERRRIPRWPAALLHVPHVQRSLGVRWRSPAGRRRQATADPRTPSAATTAV